MKKIGIIIIFLIAIVLITICYKSNQLDMKEVKSIYIYHSAFGQVSPEFKIDLKAKQLYIFRSNGISEYERNKASENEGYQVIKSLAYENIKRFISYAQSNRFLGWKSKYVNTNVLDGHQWGITITFEDSSEKQIYGSNEYPSTWNMMYVEFEKLTGENILIYKSDWMK